jgi:hypothetical protein
LCLPSSFFPLLLGLYGIGFGCSVFPSEMTFLIAVKTLSLFFWDRVCSFSSRFLESPVFPSEDPVGFSIHFVEVFFRLFLLEVGIFVVPFTFLGLSSEIIVETRRRRDQVYPDGWEFLYSYGIFNSLGKAFIKLCYFNSFVPRYSRFILGELGQIRGYRPCLPEFQ